MVEFYDRFEQTLRARLNYVRDYIYYAECIRADRLLKGALGPTDYSYWRDEKLKTAQDEIEKKTKKFRVKVGQYDNLKAWDKEPQRKRKKKGNHWSFVRNTAWS